MWTHAQKSLLDQLCDLAGFAQCSKELRQRSTLNVDDIPFTLLPGLSPDSLRIIVQLGEPPQPLRTEIYQRMLELNLLIDSGHHEQLALEPETGMALFSYEFRNDNAAQLILSLRRAAAQAHEWRYSYFIHEDETERPS